MHQASFSQSTDEIDVLISCFPIGYQEISVKIFFDLNTGSTRENTDFYILFALLKCTCLATRWKYVVIYLTFLALDAIL